MQLKQRDRPGKRGWRVIKVISIVLAGILTLSSISAISNVFADKSTVKGSNIVSTDNNPDRIGPIVMPENMSVIYRDTTPFSGRFRDPNYSYSLTDNHFTIEAEKYYSRTHIYFTDESPRPVVHGFDILDYDYIKIEFDLFNYLATPAVDCEFALRGFTSADSGIYINGSHMYISSLEDSSKMMLETKNGKTFEGETFHIEYLIKVNESTPKYSDMDIYVNGELVNSVSYISDKYVTKLAHIEFSRLFGAEDTGSSLGAGNLLITGCK